MADFVFDIHRGNLCHGWGHQAARGAVLFPLLRRKGDAAPEPVPSGLQRLLGMWRKRILALRAAGWSCLVGHTPAEKDPTPDDPHAKGKSLNLQFIRNCPPFGVFFTRPAFRCRRGRVCPMCFARDVVQDGYQAVAYACFNAMSPDQLAGTRLLCVRQSGEPAGMTPEQIFCPAVGFPPAAKGLWSDHSRAFAALGRKLAGSRVFLSVEPAPEGKLLVRRGALLLVPAGTEVDFGEGREVKAVDAITPKALAKAVSWAFPYPRGMMFGDAAVAVAILHAAAAKRIKQCGGTGLCDNAGMRRALAAMNSDRATQDSTGILDG